MVRKLLSCCKPIKKSRSPKRTKTMPVSVALKMMSNTPQTSERMPWKGNGLWVKRAFKMGNKPNKAR